MDGAQGPELGYEGRWEGAGARGSSAGLRESPWCSVLSQPASEAHGARGGGGQSESRVGARRRPPSSGLAVALVDVVLHEGHHLLKFVLQLRPPGRGVRLQGAHDLGRRGGGRLAEESV